MNRFPFVIENHLENRMTEVEWIAGRSELKMVDLFGEKDTFSDFLDNNDDGHWFNAVSIANLKKIKTNVIISI